MIKATRKQNSSATNAAAALNWTRASKAPLCFPREMSNSSQECPWENTTALVFPWHTSFTLPPSASQAMVIEIPPALVWPLVCLTSDSEHFISSVHPAAAKHPQEKSIPLLWHNHHAWRCIQDFFVCFGEEILWFYTGAVLMGAMGGLGQ